ncbi:MAG: PP2C family protein-serine/threonine phosphatase [Gammaproteobacteria bacterium]
MKFDVLKRFGMPPKKNRNLTLHSYCLSHPGKVRANNEDSFLEFPELQVWAVADGMGGHHCGEVASAIGLTTLHRSLVAGDDLVDAIQKAHLDIKGQAEQEPEKTGMGTTLVALQVEADDYRVAWVGDSRAYLWRNGLTQLTRDHSYLQMLLDQGLIDRESAKTHPFNNIILQALGSSDKELVTVDVIDGKLEKDDIVLLCSDGLTGQVNDAEIAAILAGDCKPDQKADQLMAAALANEADDNITLIVLAVTDMT